MINFNECLGKYGTKPKIIYCPYQRPGKKYHSIFGLDIAFKNKRKDLYILLTSLDNTCPSYVTADIEIIATLVYLALRAQDWLDDNTHIHWYELDLSHPTGNFHMSSVTLEYNGLTLEKPRWHPIKENDYPFDLSEFYATEPHTKTSQ